MSTTMVASSLTTINMNTMMLLLRFIYWKIHETQSNNSIEMASGYQCSDTLSRVSCKLAC
jgi:hypothetical protein